MKNTIIMKKRTFKKLALKHCMISNLHSNSLVGGVSCEAPCQGGTGCCNTGTRNEYCNSDRSLCGGETCKGVFDG